MKQEQRKEKFDLLEEKIFLDKYYIAVLKEFTKKQQSLANNSEKVLWMLKVDSIASDILGKNLASPKFENDIKNDRTITISNNNITFSMEKLNSEVSLFNFLKDYFYELKLNEIKEQIKNNDVQEVPYYDPQVLIDEASQYAEKMVLESIKVMMKRYGKGKDFQNYIVEMQENDIIIKENNNRKR